ncbi:MAG TPA: hypothetical protein VNT81_07535 [Vicinamibacterales bacterium]|nr:hypothetical protein [Vicinamibacterales bacterium]
MSLYTKEEERAIRVQRQVDDWTKSGLLQPQQREQMLPSLKVELRRTNLFLRITLFVFTFLIVSAISGLAVVFLESVVELRSLRWFALVDAAVCFAAAEMLVKRYRLYHFGIEEAVVVGAAASFALFMAEFTDSFSTMLGFAGATLGAIAIFVRFNYAYAAVAATLLAPMVIFDFEQSDTFRRLLAFILLFTVFFVARERREDHDPDYPSDIFGLVQAVAWAGMYLVANLRVSPWLSVPDGYDTVYWATYVVIRVLPFAGLFLAIRDRHRALLNVNIVLFVLTMLSNKPYLGAESKPWDPILFGVMMIAIAIGLRRWLSSGPGGARAGYVAERILASESDRLALAGNATVFAPGAPPAQALEAPPTFGGGESGGGGATGKF